MLEAYILFMIDCCLLILCILVITRISIGLNSDDPAGKL